jgi:hypothetical protein
LWTILRTSAYGALAFRPQDKELRDKVNAELKKWLGSEEHLRTVAPFGFDKSNITHKTAAEICGARDSRSGAIAQGRGGNNLFLII